MRTATEMADFCFKWGDLNDPETRDRLVAERMEEAKKRREEAVHKGKKPDSILWGDDENNLTYDGALKSIKIHRENLKRSWNYVKALFLPIQSLLEPGIGQTPNPNDDVIYAFLSTGTNLKYRGVREDVQKQNVAVALTRNRCIIAEPDKKKEKALIRTISYDDILRVYYDSDNMRIIVNTTTGSDVGFRPGKGGATWLDLENVGCAEVSHIVEIVENYKKGGQREAPQAVPAAPPAGTGLTAETIETLKQLKGLLDMGIITQEEFDEKKKQLLGL